MKWLKANVFDCWHSWAAIWTMVLLTYTVIKKPESVSALSVLVATMFTAAGSIHAWKETTRMKNGNGNTPPTMGFKPTQ